ncbi:MAG: histidine phosphatase family protein [Parasporobacterium sp.]|nr:histidine phosphatase family protein [Parasporobacterium sp.]
MKIALIRHGMTEGNIRKQYSGVTNDKLCPEGIEELKRLAGERPIQPDIVFASPMSRCLDTAEILFPNREPVIIDELAEMNFGIFEGRAFAGDLENDPVYRKWIEGGCEDTIPEGENKTEFAKRCAAGFMKALAMIPDEQADEDYLAAFAVHGGTIMAVMAIFADSDKEYYDWLAANGRGYMGEWNGRRITDIREI